MQSEENLKNLQSYKKNIISIRADRHWKQGSSPHMTLL